MDVSKCITDTSSLASFDAGSLINYVAGGGQAYLNGKLIIVEGAGERRGRG